LLLLDAIAQIRLFVKLKLAKCARAEMRPGFFCVGAKERVFFFLLFAGTTGRGRRHDAATFSLQGATA
jgi:hypothetical protein